MTVVPLDFQVGLSNFDQRESSYKRLLGRFLEIHRQDAVLIEKQLYDNDYESSERIAHSLKGVAGMLGGMPLASTAKDVEARIQQHESLYAMLPKIAQLNTDIHAFCDEIERYLAD